jgi:hypothetical protein
VASPAVIAGPSRPNGTTTPVATGNPSNSDGLEAKTGQRTDSAGGTASNTTTGESIVGAVETSAGTMPGELILFGIVALGIFGNWFWIVGWNYVKNPSAPNQIGPWQAVVVRLFLCLIAAALTFVPTYDKLDQNTRQSLVAYLVAFQMGFFWQSAFHAVINQPAIARTRPRPNRAAGA